MGALQDYDEASFRHFQGVYVGRRVLAGAASQLRSMRGDTKNRSIEDTTDSGGDSSGYSGRNGGGGVEGKRNNNAGDTSWILDSAGDSSSAGGVSGTSREPDDEDTGCGGGDSGGSGSGSGSGSGGGGGGGGGGGSEGEESEGGIGFKEASPGKGRAGTQARAITSRKNR